MKKGELIYVPSETLLHTLDRQGNVSNYMKLVNPTNLLVTEVNERTYEILYHGKRWLVEKDKTYGVKND